MDTKQQIISTSIRLFNQHGEELVGVREIARTLQISPGNLSYHFPRKEDILAYHMQKLEQELNILIQAYLREEEDLYRLLELIQACLERQYEYRGLFHSAAAPKLNQLHERLVTSIAKLGRQGQLQVGEDDLIFLSDLVNFQFKFWLTGIDLSEPNSKEHRIRDLLSNIVKLLLLFASPNGRINLLRFKAGLMRPA